MWDLPGPGLEPVSPALAGGFLTTAPPGKSQDSETLDGLFLKIEQAAEVLSKRMDFVVRLTLVQAGFFSSCLFLV